ncbi:tetratricopeptide repeat protein [Treponema putidum]|uniref:Tetratricopeptide repeat protein n=1 Tax=Treponema putidum TaxID=221027 RepID=A0AAE9MVQ4_9SPIR|nr:tetratricopeptide repeat protein [Treponema putidum]UTY29251.1 tetratricopeptide repeat protein [Treponema putidum]UTY31656.1 tetratricopeptide repeat protein [Treponema putidum]UTY34108.1 tetratricopeptide repeat protein [Treponema putidum]
MTERPVQSKLNKALSILKQGDLKGTYAELERLLKDDLENAEIVYTLKGVRFWDDKLERAKKASTPLERAEMMISQWKPFLSYIRRQGEEKESIIYSLKCAVFTIALEFYADLFNEDSELPDSEPYRKIGLCYKVLGNYEKALEFLKYAAEIDKNSGAVLADLADCYALYGEIKFAKAFFREAFFIDPDGIEMQFLESEIINRLIHKVNSLGYKAEEIADWVPVYGVLDGIFNVKRELRAFEVGQLKQNIFLMEGEVQNASQEQKNKLVPRLINHYFWLIDHYVSVNENKSKIDDLLLRIKVLDQNIYNCYMR